MNQSPYNDPYNITTMPPWKPAQADEPPPPAAKLSPRAKAGLGLGFACVAAAGVFTWSQYETAQASAHLRSEQIALDTAKVDLAQQQQAAAQAQAAAQETPAEKARRLAVEACIAEVGSNYGAVSQCGQVYPVAASPTLTDVSNTASTTNASGSGSDVGVIVLGSLGAVLMVGWVKKRLPARSSS
jgi:hypothetical protein